EGLRAEVNRIREALKDNQLPPSAAQSRMDSVANELERLAREELEQVEPLLNSARESGEQSSDPMKASPQKSDPMKGDAAKPEATRPEPMKGDAAKPDAARPDPMKGETPKPGERSKEPLAEALKHQREVEQTLEQLLQRLEPWSGANEVRGEARA